MDRTVQQQRLGYQTQRADEQRGERCGHRYDRRTDRQTEERAARDTSAKRERHDPPHHERVLLALLWTCINRCKGAKEAPTIDKRPRFIIIDKYKHSPARPDSKWRAYRLALSGGTGSTFGGSFTGPVKHVCKR